MPARAIDHHPNNEHSLVLIGSRVVVPETHGESAATTSMARQNRRRRQADFGFHRHQVSGSSQEGTNVFGPTQVWDRKMEGSSGVWLIAMVYSPRSTEWIRNLLQPGVGPSTIAVLLARTPRSDITPSPYCSRWFYVHIKRYETTASRERPAFGMAEDLVSDLCRPQRMPRQHHYVQQRTLP